MCFYFQQLQTKKSDQLDNNDSELFQSKLIGEGLVTETYKSVSAKSGFRLKSLDWLSFVRWEQGAIFFFIQISW